ncbi:hypothetical protein GOBAR_AA08208 [Gossypium barbadense]|uniref:Disease resistance protein At4g27190-like leucine-rich repeats domain-containing protein n=1 Tax=Gossypium barbadense TaxID=3634 RepID=A0A2P5YA10_GOSBA|nr:hypothetical protein GOBAR_AA08208 [Gossypium barbadense]
MVQLDCLDDDEAWTLFEKKAGLNDFSDDSIKILANQIVTKCGGSPIAIVPLGSALKGKTHHEWQVANRRLKDRRLTEIEDVNEENAYVCLEASFDYLKNMETKTCFLLCSLFPEDDEIYVENLVGYAWGLELYSIKDVRSEVLASIETLKSSGLLLDCGERHVKMHDVVCQFALWIAFSRKEISFGTVETLLMDESFKHYTAISFETDQTDELPKGHYKFMLWKIISLDAFKFNMNIRILCLIDCELSDISMLGKLKTLHNLSLSQSDITELPTEADACKQLFEDVESLQLNDVEGHPNLIPSLNLRFSKLTFLDLDWCDSMQCLIDASKKLVPITVFSNLRKLSLINMFDLEEMCNVPQLQGFLQKLEEVIVSDCDKMQMLFPIAELESLEQEVPSRHLSLQSLKIVEIERCNNLKYIFPVANSPGQLHALKIKSFRSLEGIIQDSQVPYISIQSLREIEVEKYDNLKCLFPVSVANSLGQLHTLMIKSCRSLEGIIQDSQVPYISL